jgi:hypothetical protein
MNGSVPRGAAEVISQAIEDDQVFTDTDGYRSIRMRGAEKYAEIALAALEAAGFAVVQLPEPSYVDDPDDNGEKGYGFNGPGGSVTTLAEHGVYAYGGMVYDQYDGWTPEQARTIASWWLAASLAVSGDEK